MEFERGYGLVAIFGFGNSLHIMLQVWGENYFNISYVIGMLLHTQNLKYSSTHALKVGEWGRASFDKQLQ